jgi:transposase-like protein
MTKRKNYTIVEKLKIIERVKKGKSKTSLFREHGIPEGTIRVG